MPVELHRLFEKAPLLRDEDPTLYWSLFNAFARKWEPQDVIEWLLLKDLVDNHWANIRYHGIIPAVIDAGQKKAVAEIFKPLDGLASQTSLNADYERDKVRSVVNQWSNLKTRSTIEARLRDEGLDTNTVVAVSFSQQLPAVVAAERILTELETRRNSIYYLLEIYRQKSSQVINQPSTKLVDASVRSFSSRRVAK